MNISFAKFVTYMTINEIRVEGDLIHNVGYVIIK